MQWQGRRAAGALVEMNCYGPTFRSLLLSSIISARNPTPILAAGLILLILYAGTLQETLLEASDGQLDPAQIEVQVWLLASPPYASLLTSVCHRQRLLSWSSNSSSTVILKPASVLAVTTRSKRTSNPCPSALYTLPLYPPTMKHSLSGTPYLPTLLRCAD